MNVGKRKIMVRNNWKKSTVITAEGTNVEMVEELGGRDQTRIQEYRLDLRRSRSK